MGNTYLSTTACIMLDLWSNTHCFWSGMPLTASAPNALSPFLPTLIEALERQEHLHFSDECRSQLLSMNAAGRHGLSTTCAGTLLKQQIPIRTFTEWNETQLGLTFSGTGAPTVTPTERAVTPTHERSTT